MELILSGIGGAIIGALITVLLQCWFDEVRERRLVILKTVAWIDQITTRLQALSVYKLALSEGKTLPISTSKYNAMSNELRLAILSNLVLAEIGCTYDEGNIMKQIKEIQGELITVTGMYWTANLEDWPAKNKEIINLFTNIIEPRVDNIMKDLFYSLKIISIIRKQRCNLK